MRSVAELKKRLALATAQGKDHRRSAMIRAMRTRLREQVSLTPSNVGTPQRKLTSVARGMEAAGFELLRIYLRVAETGFGYCRVRGSSRRAAFQETHTAVKNNCICCTGVEQNGSVAQQLLLTIR